MSDAPIAVTIELPASQVAAFDSLLRDIAKQTGRSIPSIVEQGMVYFLQSCSTSTPMAGKRRTVESNPSRKPPYRYRRYRQGMDPVWVYTDNRMDTGRLIERRGLARNTWKALIGASSRKSAALTGNAAQTGGIAKSVTRAFIEKEESDAAITVYNQLGYMALIAPNVLSDGMSKAQKRMENYLLRKTQQDIEKKWRS